MFSPIRVQKSKPVRIITGRKSYDIQCYGGPRTVRTLQKHGGRSQARAAGGVGSIWVKKRRLAVEAQFFNPSKAVKRVGKLAAGGA